MVRKLVLHLLDPLPKSYCTIVRSADKELLYDFSKWCSHYTVYIYLVVDDWPYFAPPRMSIGVRPALTIFNANLRFLIQNQTVFDTAILNVYKIKG